MDILRAIAAVILTIVIYKHALLWGRFFFNLHGMNCPLSVSTAYLRPTHRFFWFLVPQMVLLIVVSLLWPWGYWGLCSLLIAGWAFKSGMRCELLLHFVRQLLLNVEAGLDLETAWVESESTISSITGLASLNTRVYASHPNTLIRYVVRIALSRSEAAEINKRWSDWLNSNSAQLDAIVEKGVGTCRETGLAGAQLHA